MKRITLEVCTATLSDALSAVEGGADRLELNSALELGGLTPSPGSFLQIRERISVPLCVMIRPRPGAFCYGMDEFETMRADARWFLENGADAIVFGVLLADGEIDVSRCQELVEIAGPGRAIFHRAFDLTPDPFRALEKLIELNFLRVMTSGQEPMTFEGKELIARLVKEANQRIEILPAGGVTLANVGQILRVTGCDQVHASLRDDRFDLSAKHRLYIRFGTSSGSGEAHYRATDPSLVREMRLALDALHKSNPSN